MARHVKVLGKSTEIMAKMNELICVPDVRLRYHTFGLLSLSFK